jgi:hypothetical protein
LFRSANMDVPKQLLLSQLAKLFGKCRKNPLQ